MFGRLTFPRLCGCGGKGIWVDWKTGAVHKCPICKYFGRGMTYVEVKK